MQTVTLTGTPVTTTVLGYGCSALLGEKSREEAKALLQAAFDSGVRHFDVARVYGYGDAERILGEWIQERGIRKEVTITTKFGLQPSNSVAKAPGLLSFVRSMMRMSPWIRALVRRRVYNVIEKGNFDVPSARASLQTSLEALKTDRIDIYLLHESEASDCQPELLEFLKEATAQSKITCFGHGANSGRSLNICREAPEFAHIAQFEDTLLNKPSHLQQIQAPGKRACITHGTFSALKPIKAHLLQDAAFAQSAAQILQVKSVDDKTLTGLLFQYAAQQNPGGLTLFRSGNVERIRENVESCHVAGDRFSPEQILQFAKLAQDSVPTPTES
jgi:aryl-alcohol dehydrogenase-like predicted oxidoreductase